MLKLTAAFFFFLSVISFSSAGLGRCPDAKPVPGFNMHGMVGKWYVIQDTISDEECETYNIQKKHESDDFTLEIVSKKVRGVKTLSLRDPKVSDKWVIKYPSKYWGIPSQSSFIVIASDYDKYAVIFTCNNFEVFHSTSATILSRTPHLDSAFVDKSRFLLSKISTRTLNKLYKIDQSKCSHGDRFDVNIGESFKKSIEPSYETPMLKKGVEELPEDKVDVKLPVGDFKDVGNDKTDDIPAEVADVNSPPTIEENEDGAYENNDDEYVEIPE